MSMNTCPAELLALIVERVPTDQGLRSLRAVDKTFCALATPLAFRRAYVTNSLPSAQGLRALMECHELAKTVETIIFRWGDTSGDMEDAPTKRATYVALIAVFAQLHRFPGLMHVELNMFPGMPDPLVVGDTGHLEEYPSESSFVESTVLKALLRGAGLPRLKSLTMANLMPFPFAHYESREFADLLSSVEHLHISFHGEDSVRGSRGREMWNSLWHEVVPIHFLGPTQMRLTSLTLMSDQPVGRVPRIDLSGLFFPVLRHLELGGITFDHHRRIEDFIVRHGKTLATLVLDSCPMHMPNNNDGPLWSWCDVCDRFAENLEGLVDVQFHVREGWGLDNRKRTGEVRLFYHSGDTSYGGERGKETRAHEAADRPAIDRLLEKVRKRREKEPARIQPISELGAIPVVLGTPDRTSEAFVVPIHWV
ncbi:hypothetical protein C8Q73DRAFT_789726 [Cubamyces lactineus]|nr:hypothetical protein C8Q73DRAFT_789726 [Cubamyces lactineus]